MYCARYLSQHQQGQCELHQSLPDICRCCRPLTTRMCTMCSPLFRFQGQRDPTVYFGQTSQKSSFCEHTAKRRHSFTICSLSLLQESPMWCQGRHRGRHFPQTASGNFQSLGRADEVERPTVESVFVTILVVAAYLFSPETPSSRWKIAIALHFL